MGKTTRLTLTVRTVAILLLVCCLSAITISAHAKAQKRKPPKKADAIEATVNLLDYGAVGDNSTDAGPALQQALDDLASAGGGTLIVPAGHYRLATAVHKQFAPGVSLTIQGEFSSTPIDVSGNGLGLDLTSRFIIAVGQSNDALTLSGLDSLLVKDIAFEGVEEALNDAHVVLKLSQIKAANVLHSEFYGLASLTDGGAIVWADHSDLSLQETAFLGCSNNSALSTSTVQNTSWLGILVRDCKFIDYGQSGFYSKTPLAPAYSWISVGNPADLLPSSSRREAIIDHVILDEGAFFAISARNIITPTDTPFELYLSRLYVNVSNLNAAGLYILGAQKVFIDQSHFGWSHITGGAFVLSNVGDAIVDLVDTSEEATAISVTANSLTVINSDFSLISSPLADPRIINTASPEEDPAQYVRQTYSDVLQHDPDAAGHFYWTNKLLLCNDDAACLNQTKALLAAFLAAAPPAKVSVSGTVVDENGAALEGAQVSLSGSQAVAMETDEHGSFAFQKLASAGEYLLTPTKNHYEFSSNTVVTPTGDQTKILTGTRLRHTISGHVDSSTGQDLDGVMVTLSGSAASTTTTDDKGNFSFPDLPGGGNYTVSVSRANYDFTADASFLDLSADQLCSFTGTLRYVVSGMVSTTKGDASVGLQGVQISVAGTVSATTVTDNNGGYSLLLPAEGDYTIAAQKTNYQFEPKNLVLSNLSNNQVANFIANAKRPVLLASGDSTRLLALDAVLRTIEPFALTYDHNWSEDSRTRIVLFATNFEFETGDSASDFVVEVEDSSHRVYPFTVECANTIRLDSSITRFVVRLSDDLTDIGDVKLRLSYKGTYSDPLLMAIGHTSTGSSN